MTHIELINAVLRRLRESEVVTPSENSYAKLIGDFVNETKREVEDSWNWNVNMTTIQINTEDGVARYEVTDSGNRYVVINIQDETNNGTLSRETHQAMTNNLLFNPAYGYPSSYDFNDKTSSGDTYVDLYPIPNGVYTINFNMYVPQPNFSTGNELLEVPSWPVILGAYAKAIAERGEDQGRTHGEVTKAYTDALSDAIALDNANTLGEDIWYV